MGDCAVRAISAALDLGWDEAFDVIAQSAKWMADMPSSDSVWGAVLRAHGFYRAAIPSDMPPDYTAADFARDNPRGVYVLGFGGHVAAVIDGQVWDSWDSTREIPQFYWFEREA